MDPRSYLGLSGPRKLTELLQGIREPPMYELLPFEPKIVVPYADVL